MESLSVASAAANLLSISVHIAGCLYRKWDDNSRPGSERLMYEVSRLRSLLENIEIESSIEQPIMAGELRRSFDDTKTTLLDLLVTLNGDIHYEWLWETYSSSRPGACLPLSRQDLDRFARLLLSHFTEIRKNAQNVPFFRITRVATSVPNAHFSNKLWGRKADYESAHNYAQSLHVNGTGVWLLNKIKTWMRTQRKPNVLYCSGGPGTGKTILTSAVINSILEGRTNGPDVAVAYFYFKYNIASPMVSVAIALLEQLYRQSPTLAQEVVQLQQNAETGPPELREILPVLLAVARRFGRCFVVLDALDECAPEHKADLATFLDFLSTSGCRILATSRRQPHPVFEECAEIEVVADVSDIGYMIAEYLQKDPSLPQFIKQADSKIHEHVMNHCHGSFLMASFLCQSLIRARTELELDAQLLLAPISDLNATYDENMERINALEPSQRFLASTTLTWLYYSQRPLKIAEVVDICQRTATKTEPPINVGLSLILSVCMGFVVSEPDNGTILFTHLTVREYFETQIPEATLLGPEETVAEACLSSLLLRDGYTRESPARRYAATFWGRHLKQDRKPSENLQSMVEEYLSDGDKTPLQTITDWILSTEAWVGKDISNFAQGIQQGTTGLHVVAYFGLSWAFELITHKTLVGMDKKDPLGRTALHLATAQPSMTCLAWLLDHDADFRTADHRGQNALHHAAQYGSYPIIKCLVDRTIQDDACSHNPNLTHVADNDRMTPVDHAAKRGIVNNLHEILRLVSHGRSSWPDLNSAVRHALKSNQFGCVELLVQSDLGVVVTPENLSLAAEVGLVDAVRLFLSIGIDMDASTQKGETALHAAARAGKHTVLEVLIMAGADLEVTDDSDLTPLASAVVAEDKDAVGSLIKGGASVTATVDEGETLLEYALRNELAEIVTLLVESGAQTPNRIPVDTDTTWYDETPGSTPIKGGTDRLDSKDIHFAPTYAKNSQDSDLGLPVQQSVIEASAPKPQLPLYKTTDTRPDPELTAPPSYHNRDVSQTDRRRTDPRLVGGDFSLTKSAKRSTPPFIVSHEAVSPNMLPLGTIVSDPRSPLTSYFPESPEELHTFIDSRYIHTTKMSNFQLQHARTSPKGSSIRALFASSSSQTQRTEERHVAALECTREILINHPYVLGKIVDTYGAHIIRLVDARKKAYIVIGRMILKDAETETRNTQEFGSNLSVSIGVDMAHIGVPVSAGLSTSHMGMEVSNASRSQSRGDVVYALQYAQLRVDTGLFNRGKLNIHPDGYARGYKHEELF